VGSRKNFFEILVAGNFKSRMPITIQTIRKPFDNRQRNRILINQHQPAALQT